MTPNDKNICKFVAPFPAEKLTTISFVLEKHALSPAKNIIRSHTTMNLVAAGEGRLHIGARSWELRPGTLFFLFDSEETGVENLGELQYMYIGFHSESAKPMFERFGITPVSRVFYGYEGLMSFWQSALGKASEKNLDLVSESVLLYTFAQMTPPAENTEQYRVAGIINQIEARFSDSRLTLEACAGAIGYNSKYISRIFSKNVGITFSEYLTSTRIKHAVFLIEQGITSVKNLSILCGYADPAYFSNVFRKTVGIPPSDYIARTSGREKSDTE